MTLLVDTKIPPRYACERCECEIGAGDNPAQRVIATGTFGWGSAAMQPDDDPLVFDMACECVCHDNYKIMRQIPMPYRAFKPWTEISRQRIPPIPDEYLPASDVDVDDEPW